jgi:hypothetical protein
MRSILILGILLLSTLAGLVPSLPTARASQTWSSPLGVSTGTATDELPTAVNAGSGLMITAWETDVYASGEFDIAAQTMVNGTGVWSSATRLTNSGQNSAPDLVQLPNGTILLFWARRMTSDYQIYYKTYDGFWSTTNVQVTFSKFNDTTPAAVVGRDGTLWLFWARANNTAGTYQIYYKTLRGNTWSADTQFTSNSNLNWQPSALVARDGRIWLTWSSAPAGSYFQIYDSIYNGTVWSSPVQLITSTVSDEHPSIMQDRNGTIWNFWSRDVNYNSTLDYWVLYSQFSFDNGKTWLPANGPLQMTNTANTVDSLAPFAIQSLGSDKSIWLFYVADPVYAPNIYALQSSPISPVHDVYISSIVAPTSQYPPQFQGGLASIGQSPVVSVNVTVANLGDYVETVNVTLTAFNVTSYPVGSIKTSIANGASIIFLFQWTTTQYTKPGRYGFTASIPSLTGETVGNNGGNSLSFKEMAHIIPLGSVDLSGFVSFEDLAVCFHDFGATPGTQYWNPYCDVNNAGIINFADLAVVAYHFGQSG